MHITSEAPMTGLSANPPMAGLSREAPASGLSRRDAYARAEQSMRSGKRLVIGGFVISVLGIGGYCLACFGAAVHPDLHATLLSSPGRFAGPALGVIGLGSLLWLVGSFVFLSGAMDSDPDGPDLNF